MTAVRGLVDDPVGFDRGYWRRGAELGWTAMLVPEALGGGSITGKGLLDLALVAEEFGQTVAPGPAAPGQRRRRRTGPCRHARPPGGGATGPGLRGGDGHLGLRRGGRHLGRRWGGAGRHRRGRRLGPRGRQGVRPGRRGRRLVPRDRPNGGGRGARPSSWCRRGADGVRVDPLVSLDMVRRFGNLHLGGSPGPGLGRGRHRRRRRGRRRAPAAGGPRAAERRDGGRRRQALRHRPRVLQRPGLLRPAHRVVPGAEAPPGRDEAGARSLPRDLHGIGQGRAGRGRRRRPTGADVSRIHRRPVAVARRRAPSSSMAASG